MIYNDNNTPKQEWKEDKNFTPLNPVSEEAPLFTEETPEFHNEKFHSKPAHLYTYHTADGQAYGHMLRYNVCHEDKTPKLKGDGTQEKQIIPYLYGQYGKGIKKWWSKGFPEPRPLYNLHKIKANPEAIVLINEGEKAADAAEKLFPDYVSTTSANGAKSPNKTDWSPVNGRDVIISADFDVAGIDYAEKVAGLCRRAGAQSVRYLFPEMFHVLNIPYFEKKIREREWLSPRIDVDPLFNKTEEKEESSIAIENNPNKENTPSQSSLEKSSNGQPFSWTISEDAAHAIGLAEHLNYEDRDNLPFDSERVPKKGYDLADALEEGWTADLVKGVIDEVGEQISPSILIKQIFTGIPKGYDLKPSGVFLKGTDKTGDTKICGYLAVTHKIAAGRSNKSSLRMEFIDRFGQHRTKVISMSLLGGDGTDLQKKLLDEDFSLSLSKSSKDHLRHYINRFNPQKTALLVNQIGWHKGRYVLPHYTYAAGNSVEEVIFNTEEADPVYHQRGTSEEWKDNIAKPAEENSILEFIIGCQFTAPLLGLAEEDNFIINLFGQSTTGKSTALHGACSVTGKFMKNGDCNKLPSWRGTANGTEASARESNDSCMILDELHQATAAEIVRGIR